jgi:hypothetical protein
MVLHATSPPLAPWLGWAIATSEAAAAPWGKPTLLVEGRPVGPMEREVAGCQIVDATVAELELLQRGGYRLDLAPT